MDQVVVFQKMFEQVRKEQNFSWFYSELKHHRIAHLDLPLYFQTPVIT